MATIKTVSNAAGRTIEVEMPAIFHAETLADIAKIQGEDLCIQHIKAQLSISFRSVIRNLLEKKDDNDEFIHSDETISSMPFTDWCPTLRVTKSLEDKALDALGALDPEVRKLVLATFDAEKAAKAAAKAADTDTRELDTI